MVRWKLVEVGYFLSEWRVFVGLIDLQVRQKSSEFFLFFCDFFLQLAKRQTQPMIAIMEERGIKALEIFFF